MAEPENRAPDPPPDPVPAAAAQAREKAHAQAELLADVRRHVAALISDQEAEVRVAGFARLYAAFAVLFVALSFMPLYLPKLYDDSDWVIDFGNVWQMAGTGRGGPAIIGILLLAGLVAMLVYGAFQLRLNSVALPVCVASAAALIALMILTKPGTGSVNPAYAPAGLAGVGACAFLAVVAIAHAVVLHNILKNAR